MEAKAVAKYVRMSPSKLKPVADLVRGKDLRDALNILKFTPGKGSEIVEKVNMDCGYCFAGKGEYHGEAQIMS